MSIAARLQQLFKPEAASRHDCYLCRQQIKTFRSWRGGSSNMPAIHHALGIIGSDVDNFLCPACKCHDRERHLAMYFDRLGLWARFAGATVLHVAPEANLVPRIVAAKPAEYIRADMMPASPEIRQMDITRIPLPDAGVDVVICNHVLEHIPDDRRALSELARVSRPGAIAILQTPWSPLLNDMFCDPTVTRDELRLRLFGQEDHVRVYGHDLFRRIEEAGFRVERHSHTATLSDFDPARYGVNVEEDLVLAVRLPA